MPFKFTGTLEKVQIKLGPNELAPQQRGELEQLKRDFALAVQRNPVDMDRLYRGYCRGSLACVLPLRSGNLTS